MEIFKPFTFLQKMRRALAKFLFSFFSSKFAVMLMRSTAIACNGLQLNADFIFHKNCDLGAVSCCFFLFDYQHFRK